MKKHTFYSEIAYIFGLLFIAMGVVFMEKADFGVSMIVAPAYVVYRKLSLTWNWFTFGMAEYCLQALLIVLMVLVMRKFRVSYLLSIATAVVYGLILDGLMLLGNFLPCGSIWLRLIWYAVGLALTGIGVSLMFHTYLSPEAYELFVKEVSAHFRISITKFKTVYDLCSCVVGILLSFLFFRGLVGIGWGTVVCAFVNGLVIRGFSLLLDKLFSFPDRLKWRPFFTGEPIKP